MIFPDIWGDNPANIPCVFCGGFGFKHTLHCNPRRHLMLFPDSYQDDALLGSSQLCVRQSYCAPTSYYRCSWSNYPALYGSDSWKNCWLFTFLVFN